jgi:hypothetical protein
MGNDQSPLCSAWGVLITHLDTTLADVLGARRPYVLGVTAVRGMTTAHGVVQCPCALGRMWSWTFLLPRAQRSIVRMHRWCEKRTHVVGNPSLKGAAFLWGCWPRDPPLLGHCRPGPGNGEWGMGGSGVGSPAGKLLVRYYSKVLQRASGKLSHSHAPLRRLSYLDRLDDDETPADRFPLNFDGRRFRASPSLGPGWRCGGWVELSWYTKAQDERRTRWEIPPHPIEPPRPPSGCPWRSLVPGLLRGTWDPLGYARPAGKPGSKLWPI